VLLWWPCSISYLAKHGQHCLERSICFRCYTPEVPATECVFLPIHIVQLSPLKGYIHMAGVEWPLGSNT
jgi:hypothetical protein